MKRIARVTGISRDRPRRVYGTGESALVGSRSPTRSIEDGEGAVRTAHKAVSHRVRVKLVPRDLPRRIDGQSEGSLEGTCSCARSIEYNDGRLGDA